MVSLANIRLDTSLSVAGVWKDDPWGQGFRFCIASAESMPFKAAMREALRLKDSDPKAYEAAYAEAVARHLLKDWSGLDDAAGQPVPYTYAQSLEFMSSPDCQHLRQWVESVAITTAEYLARTRVEAGKA